MQTDWKWMLIKLALLLFTVNLIIWAIGGEVFLHMKHPIAWVIGWFLVGFNWRTEREET